ncbi:MAG TPA: toprim domain-containing protein [Nitrospinaceae bacterium]|nr:toprim domain-containing protein [Nitrospinaceae bacterium]
MTTLDPDNIRDILTEIGYSLSDQGKYFRAKPLYRDSSSSTVLSIRKSDGVWKDFRADIGGSLEDLIRITLRLKSKSDTTSWLVNKGINPDQQARKVEPRISQTKIFKNELLHKLEADHSYWNKRGISDETIKPFQGGTTQTGKMANRYVFPIFNHKKQIIGFAGRDLKPEAKDKKFFRPKWKLIGDKSKWRYPLIINHNLIRETRRAILVESIGDMLTLWENKIQNCIVTFGISLSPDTMSLLTRLDPDRISIAFNNDSSGNSAGNKAAYTARKKLLQFFDKDQITIKLPEGHNDFNEMHLKEPSLIKNFFNET